MAVRNIELRGVRVHNLKSIDLDLPHRQLIVVCGVSGSGKTSLALDTLYAEGQRRYIESFSAYTRQFLDQFEKPAAERIEGLPPAIAVTRAPTSRSSRSTVGTATEMADYLRLLFAKIGQIHCYRCRRTVQTDTPQTVADQSAGLGDGRRLLVAFARPLSDPQDARTWSAELAEDGFVRAVIGGRTVQLGTGDEIAFAVSDPHQEVAALVIVDRLVAGQNSRERIQDSVETAFAKGHGRCVILAESEAPAAGQAPSVSHQQIDGRWWEVRTFGESLRCEPCGIDYLPLEPRSLSFNSPLGACPACEGFGNILDIDMDLVVPDPGKSLREGAIAAWNTPAYAHELEELLALAGDYGIPTDVPFRDLVDEHLALICCGVPEREFGGLNGFFQWLERRKYKMHLRVFLSRWRSYRPCPTCQGDRLRPEALAVELGGHNLGQVSRMEIGAARRYFQQLTLSARQQQIARTILQQIDARLGYLETVGLEYLTLDRTIRTLSGGEAQRVALTSALGSSLVNMLYVLDEPSVGMHPRDVGRLIEAVRGLQRRQNTVVVVEHEEAMLRAADLLIEIGPAAGERGGEVVFQGTLAEMQASDRSLTGDYLFGRLGVSPPGQRRDTNHGWIRLHGARGNNLKNITVEFPLGVLCVVTGVSGSGKSTLVQDTLYGAICRRKHKSGGKPYPYDELFGDGQIDDVVLVDQSPIGRSPRSNPVTYIKAFDEIRAVFASTIDARTHNYGAGHFSFNVDEGRCSACDGDGYKEIDMQFLADVYMKCEQCGGKRYRKEILEVTYRGRNIADVLDMTVREAFSFFRGQTKVQSKLKRLMEVGLDYLRLGQGANTLSTGEAQRLKLASYMSGAKRNRTLFILDEPTTGLHFSDIVRLLDCFDTLLSVGHSLIVVEHNLQLMKAADYLIDLGPGAAARGGEVVAVGTPEEIARNPRSATAEFLADLLPVEVSRQPA
ncbi:MAG: excinuclease ABC subunit UvrA [Pirellulaceae bacterium]